MLVFTVSRGPRRPFNGAGYIAGFGKGIVTAGGAPASRRVVLFDAESLIPLRSIWSNHSGEYVFNGLAVERRFVVIVFDDYGVFNATIRDNIEPEQ